MNEKNAKALAFAYFPVKFFPKKTSLLCTLLYTSLLCSINPLVSLLFAVLVSLHPATFLMLVSDYNVTGINIRMLHGCIGKFIIIVYGQCMGFTKSQVLGVVARNDCSFRKCELECQERN